MASTIKTERIPPRATMVTLLPGEIDGVTVRYHVVEAGRSLSIEEEPGKVHIRLFLGGSGEVTFGARAFTIREITIVVAARGAPTVVTAGSAPLGFLDIAIELSAAEEAELAKRDARFPYVCEYSDCEKYLEENKSPKTVSRALVPSDLVPRFSIGTVQTTGPDLVGEHEHGMLEQFLFGLKENRCTVRADGEEAALGEDMLLHIPLGSRHSARVEPGNALHYVWMDIFRRQEDMGYLAEAHHPITE
jgi:hypothetical protein